MNNLINEMELAFVFIVVGIIALIGAFVLFWYGFVEFLYVIWEVLFGKKNR